MHVNKFFKKAISRISPPRSAFPTESGYSQDSPPPPPLPRSSSYSWSAGRSTNPSHHTPTTTHPPPVDAPQQQDAVYKGANLIYPQSEAFSPEPCPMDAQRCVFSSPLPSPQHILLFGTRYLPCQYPLHLLIHTLPPDPQNPPTSYLTTTPQNPPKRFL